MYLIIHSTTPYIHARLDSRIELKFSDFCDNLMNQFCTAGPGPKVIKHFSYSTQLSTKFVLSINVIVGILTFISMINTTYEKFKARNVEICRYMLYFSFSKQLKFRSQLS